MTWLKIDDKLTSHPKWLTLTLEAKSLWLHASVWCAAHNNDGHIPDEAMPLIAFTGSLQAHTVESSCTLLVKARLWSRRAKAKGDGFEIINWLDYQPSRQQVKERSDGDDRRAEMKRLHAWLHKKKTGKFVKGIIDRRDGMHCRYCAELTVVTPGDRRSPQRRTYDLIDPESRWDMDASALHDDELATIAELWVVACGWCNAVKGSRTPAEADLELLPPPSRRRGDLSLSAANRSGTVRVLGTGLSGSVLSGTDLDGPAAGLSSSVTPSESVPPPDDSHYPYEGEAAS